MPTYQISTAFAISGEKKQAIAEKITEIHSRNTGAPKFAVQVLYRGLAPEDHYHGGIKTTDLKHPMIWLLAICKSGRTPDIKLNMLGECQAAIVDVLKEDGVIKEQVMLHMQEIDYSLGNNISLLNPSSLEMKGNL